MRILSVIFAFIGAACLWLAIGLVLTGTWRLRLEDMTSIQVQTFWLVGGASMCFVWAIMLAGGKDG